MNRVIASIKLAKTEEGGRKSALPTPIYHATAFFDGVPALQGTGRDCRILLGEHSGPIGPGDVLDSVALLFLYPSDVLPHLTPGMEFRIWEGKDIGTGRILQLEET